MAKRVYEKIVLLVDGTDSGSHAAEHAIRLARDQDAALIAVAVIDTETLKELLATHIFVEEEMEEYEAGLEVSARNQLAYVASLAAKAKVKLSQILLKGSCHTGVITEAKQQKADLILCGAYSSDAVKRDLAARERQLIVDTAECPVLLVG